MLVQVQEPRLKKMEGDHSGVLGGVIFFWSVFGFLFALVPWPITGPGCRQLLHQTICGLGTFWVCNSWRHTDACGCQRAPCVIISLVYHRNHSTAGACASISAVTARQAPCGRRLLIPASPMPAEILLDERPQQAVDGIFVYGCREPLYKDLRGRGSHVVAPVDVGTRPSP